jgi:hypothetical protein
LVVAGVSNFIAQLLWLLSQHRVERALDQRQLEGVVGGAGAGEQRGGGGLGAARQLALGRLDAPRLVRHAAQRHAAAAVALHDGGHRHQRERIRGAVAHLAVEVPPPTGAAADRGDQLAGLERCLDCGVARAGLWKSAIGMVRRVPSARTVSTWHRARAWPRPCRSDAWRCRPRSHATTACWRLNPPMRRAAAARLALVAGLVGVVEVRAAGALQQVAGGGRLVAQLARGTGQQRARQHAVVAPHASFGGQVGVAHQRADAQAAVGRGLDAVSPGR